MNMLKKEKIKVFVIHGPNLNLLGIREQNIYGTESFESINSRIEAAAEKLGVSVEIFQSNCEGQIIDKIHQARTSAQGIIINPAAYTHYSFAIRDAIKAVNVPAVEVHLSNIHGREEFRSKSVIAPACIGQISGFGWNSYILALQGIVEYIKKVEKGEN